MLIDRKEQHEGFAFGSSLVQGLLPAALGSGEGHQQAHLCQLWNRDSKVPWAPQMPHWLTDLTSWNSLLFAAMECRVSIVPKAWCLGWSYQKSRGGLCNLFAGLAVKPKAPGKKGQRQAVETAMCLNTASQTAVMAACICTWWPGVHTSPGGPINSQRTWTISSQRAWTTGAPRYIICMSVSSSKQHPTA